jgi:hypothetical protein
VSCAVAASVSILAEIETDKATMEFESSMKELFIHRYSKEMQHLLTATIIGPEGTDIWYC